jgi:hypothetical protein
MVLVGLLGLTSMLFRVGRVGGVARKLSILLVVEGVTLSTIG